MADSDVDPELVALLRQALLNPQGRGAVSSTGVLRSAEYIYDNAIDVSISPDETKAAAEAIYRIMTEREYSTSNWSAHELHPKEKNEETVNFIFTMDVLNFSFWSDDEENSEEGSFAVTYKGRRWTGYWAMVACLQRALEDRIPITSPAFWRDEQALTRNVLARIFRGDSAEDFSIAAAPASTAGHAGAGSGVASDIVHGFANDLAGGFGTDATNDITSGFADGIASSITNGAIDADTNGVSGEEDVGELHTESGGDDRHLTNGLSNGLANGVSTADSHQTSSESTNVAEEQITATAQAEEIDVEATSAAEEPQSTITAPVEAEEEGSQLNNPPQEQNPVPEPEPEYTGPTIPLLNERLSVLREAGRVMHEQFDDSIPELINSGDKSAAELITLLTSHFRSFRDAATFEGRRVNFYKRASILVADLWAAFDGASYGEFTDIDDSSAITVFADYRVPQILRHMGCLQYSPPLDLAVKDKRLLDSGGQWEMQIRGCTIWCCELILRQIKRHHPEAKVNSVLLDFFLYDLTREKLREGEVMAPHHRTRSVYY